ncbi:MAG TPA: RNA 2',3'-cyclic phosphodiesterase [Candidatus Nanoarchaeia archaeon]|nr:RNA 2',3'-cyclic phosphodiesterase [Candidatus Nanoarchaeia archaeon]
MKKRLFVGVPLSPEVKQAIAEQLLTLLQQSGADLHLVTAEQLHFTLKFLGEVDESQIERVKEILREVAASRQPFLVRLQNVGVFPSPEYMRVIWVGVENGDLPVLMKELDEQLGFICKNEQEEKPHVTLARVKSKKNKEQLQQFVTKFQQMAFGEMRVTELVLYESTLTTEGARYEVVGRFGLVE